MAKMMKQAPGTVKGAVKTTLKPVFAKRMAPKRGGRGR